MTGKLNRLVRPGAGGLFVAGILACFLLAGCAVSADALEAELPDDGAAPPTSAAAAGRFVQKVADAGEGATSTGRFTLTVTDAEVTSFLSIGSILRRQVGNLPVGDLDQIQDMPELEGVDLDELRQLLRETERLPALGEDGLRARLTIRDPQVHFLGNGQMIVRGNVGLLIAELPVRFVAAPRASQGELVLDFVEGQVGPVTMPEILFDYLGKRLARALLAGREYAEITAIRVTEGVLTISGRWNR